MMAGYEELVKETEKMGGDVFYSAECTDSYSIGYWNSDSVIDENKLLDLRVFNGDKEVRLSRKDIGRPFEMRIIYDCDDTSAIREKRRSFDEWQLLDVDEKKSRGMNFAATGGGEYTFMLEGLKHPAVLIRYYLDSYPRSGQTYVSDWRCVRFGEWGEK